jgi:hypothetical protein
MSDSWLHAAPAIRRRLEQAQQGLSQRGEQQGRVQRWYEPLLIVLFPVEAALAMGTYGAVDAGAQAE